MQSVDDRPRKHAHMPTGFAKIQDLSVAPILSSSDMAPRRKGRATGARRRRKRMSTVKRSRATIRKGMVHVKIGKNRSVALRPSQLIAYMPMNKMRQAAKLVLTQSPTAKRARRKK